MQIAAASAGRSAPAAVNVKYGWLFVTGDVAVFQLDASASADVKFPPAWQLLDKPNFCLLGDFCKLHL